jgi:predicted Zn-dependent peptidase
MPLPNRIAAGIAMALAFTPFAARAQDLREARLSNGLRVIVRESFEKDLVGLALAVDGGNRTEPRELSGLSHYYEHLVFRGGTRRQAELETRKAFFALGEFSGFTTADYTDYDFLVPAANFDEALWRFADAILHLDVTAEKVAKEREVVLSEFKMSYADSPPGWAWYNLARAAFRRHPYGRTTIGLREVVESAGIEQLQRFYAERYVPNHMVLAIAGAIPAEAAFEKVRAAFGAAQPGAPSFETGEAEPPQEGPRAVVEAREAEKSYIAVGWKAPGVLSPHADGLRVLAEVLGGGRASRLEREVRARRGLALEVGAWWSETKDPWLFEAAMTVEPGREVAALEALVDEARRLREADVPAEELEDAKNALATAFTFDDESPLSQARTIARCAVLGDVRLARERAARIRSVTAADVRAAARAVFEAAGATVSIVRPERSGEAPAEAALLAALSRTEAAKEPPPGPRPRRTLARVLACGVRAVVREDFSAPIVAASRPESPGRRPSRRVFSSAGRARSRGRRSHGGSRRSACGSRRRSTATRSRSRSSRPPRAPRRRSTFSASSRSSRGSRTTRSRRRARSRSRPSRRSTTRPSISSSGNSTRRFTSRRRSTGGRSRGRRPPSPP